ncbi:MAG: 23S rRNA (adenine(2503)-C(2))-methyltransferase RlmN, partial [Phycisphaerae bacterium]|nr:23S rRNA (adenine(2503)-C(2))-methyltransferase RlmN [Phycisphaerae bacterium]
MIKDLKNYTFDELVELMGEYGGKKFHARYIFSFIHAKDATSIDEFTTLKKDLRARLADDGFYIFSVDIVEKLVDPDGTIKYLFGLEDDVKVESVLLTNKDRRTLCISCQAGCRMGCAFCATAKLKFRRNLTAAEIVDQVNAVSADIGTVNNIVYMGMGEPFDNYDEVMRSLHILNHHAGKNIGQRHLTVSTCGLPDKILEFAEEKLQVHLAISLHAATDEGRAKLMPTAKAYPLKQLFEAIHGYQKVTRRRVMFEYCMIKGVNDSDEDANAVLRLIKGLNANVNLIEYNPHPGCKFKPSSRQRIEAFFDILMQGGIETTARYKRGQKIKAACGQLGATWEEY